MALIASACGANATDNTPIAEPDPIPVETDGGIGDGADPLPTITTTTTVAPEPVVEPEHVHVDVAVIGDSLAGWSAAIAAAREGASVALIGIDDTPDSIGGQATEGGVPSWDGNVFRGMDRELRERVAEHYREVNVSLSGCYKAFWSSRNADGTWRDDLVYFSEERHDAGDFCPHTDVLEATLWTMLDEEGVLYVPAVGAGWNDDGLVSNDDYVIDAEVWVEATETGEMIPVDLRREISDECQQDITLVFILSEPSTLDDNPTVAEFAASIEVDPEWNAFWRSAWEYGHGVTPNGHSWAQYWRVADGAHPTFFDNLSMYRRTTGLDGRVHLPLNWGNDGRTVEDSIHYGEQAMVVLADTEFADWHVEQMTEPYQRTSHYRLNAVDFMESAPRNVDSHPDSIGLGGNYFADFHGHEGQCDGVLGSEPWGQYDVPAGVFLPEERTNLLVAMPRSANVSDVVAASIRMHPPELELGWSIGVWAAMAAEQDVLPHDVDIDELRQRKLDSDTYAPIVDVP